MKRDDRLARSRGRQRHLRQLRQEFERFIAVPFPRNRSESPPLPNDLGGALADMALYDSYIAGCLSQLSYHDHPDLQLCRRVLVADEGLTERIRSTPAHPIKGEMLAYKTELDNLIGLARLLLADLE